MFFTFHAIKVSKDLSLHPFKYIHRYSNINHCHQNYKRLLNTRFYSNNNNQKMTSTQWDPEAAVPEEIKKLLTPKSNNNRNYNYINAFYRILTLLKSQERTGWVMEGIPKPESIADHMYRMSLIAMSINTESYGEDAKIDQSKCVKIALVHDIAESLVGDIVPHDVKIDKFEKNRREYSTILYLQKIVKPYNPRFAEELLELWLDYEDQRNLEAKIVKDIDKFELLIQTFEYERASKGEKKLDEFFNSRQLIKTTEIQQLADDLIVERDEFWAQVNKDK